MDYFMFRFYQEAYLARLRLEEAARRRRLLLDSDAERGTGPKIPDRAALRTDLQVLRVRFHALVASLADEDWRRKGAGSAWTVGELLAHCLGAVRAIPREVDSVRMGRDLANLPHRIFNPIRIAHARIAGRFVSRHTIGTKFDAAIDAALATLATIRDDEWFDGSYFYDEGFWTIEFIMRHQPAHFDEHAATIRAILGLPAPAARPAGDLRQAGR